MIGSTINLKSGHRATITRTGMSDFIGDPYPIYYQYVDNGEVKTGIMMSNELKEAK